jgi:carotenoid cleavage dioxygenase-like enzyme
MNTYSGEVVFSPRPGSTADDDGWLVTVLTDIRERASSLVVLDARELREVARARLPIQVPLGFHAEWAPLGAVLSS